MVGMHFVELWSMLLWWELHADALSMKDKKTCALLPFIPASSSASSNMVKIFWNLCYDLCAWKLFHALKECHGSTHFICIWYDVSFEIYMRKPCRSKCDSWTDVEYAVIAGHCRFTIRRNVEKRAVQCGNEGRWWQFCIKWANIV